MPKYHGGTRKSPKFLVPFFGACFWMAERPVSDQASTDSATFRRLVRGPKLASRSGIRRWVLDQVDLAVLGACFVYALLVVERCCDYWVLCFALLSFFFVLQVHDFFLWTVWPDSFPQIVGSLCYQPKNFMHFFFRGNPSNLPYIRSVSFPPCLVFCGGAPRER